MKENKKAILDILKKKSKKDGKFENLVLNLALQKIDSDNFEFDGEAVYTADKKRLVYYMNHDASFTIPEGVEIIGEMAFRGKKQLSHVIIPSTVKEIEHDAFYDCDELDNIYELHFIDGDTDFLVLEVPGKDSKEPSKNKKDEKVSEKKANAEKKEKTSEKKANLEKKEKTSEKKTVEENAEKKETSEKKNNKAKKESAKTK